MELMPADTEQRQSTLYKLDTRDFTPGWKSDALNCRRCVTVNMALHSLPLKPKPMATID